MIEVTFLKVFVDENEINGDIVPVIIDEGRKIPDNERIGIARELDSVETAFINNLDERDMSIVHSQGEIGFAGTVALGISWYLSDRNGSLIASMKGRDGVIETWQDNGLVWVSADPSTFPDWNIVKLDSADKIEKLSDESTRDVEHTMFWAWSDKDKCEIRARTFAPDWDIPEAEANGSGAMMLALQLDRELLIVHGKGSVIHAKIVGKNACLGGKVVNTGRKATG